MSRRQLLRAGGLTLALPFLPSLATRRPAYGAESSMPVRRAFVAMCTPHGGITPANMYPGGGALQRASLLPGHDVRVAPLAATNEGGDTVVSQVLRAPSSKLTPRIVSRMLVQRGLDVPFYLSHHTGGHLGNVAGNDGVAGGEQKEVQAFPNPTMDQVIAWSRATYPDIGGVSERSLTFGANYSWNWSSPSTRSGSIQPARGLNSPQAWFDRIFGAATAPAAAAASPMRRPLVDHVLGSYKSLRESDARLSAADRRRLDDYMDRLAELQRKLAVRPAPSCRNVKKPEPTGQTPEERYRAFNDVIAASIVCGLTRVFVFGVNETFVPSQGDWHQQVAHTHDQSRLVPSNRAAFQSILLDLANKLDVDAGDGSTHLDHALLYWSQESGHATHHPMNAPVVTIGSAGRAIKTGLYVDWRNMEGAPVRIFNAAYNPGILINRWWSTVMSAFGVPRAEWEGTRNRGFGLIKFSRSTAGGYSQAHQDGCGDPLPVIT